MGGGGLTPSMLIAKRAVVYVPSQLRRARRQGSGAGQGRGGGKGGGRAKEREGVQVERAANSPRGEGPWKGSRKGRWKGRRTGQGNGRWEGNGSSRKGSGRAAAAQGKCSEQPKGDGQRKSQAEKGAGGLPEVEPDVVPEVVADLFERLVRQRQRECVVHKHLCSTRGAGLRARERPRLSLRCCCLSGLLLTLAELESVLCSYSGGRCWPRGETAVVLETKGTVLKKKGGVLEEERRCVRDERRCVRRKKGGVLDTRKPFAAVGTWSGSPGSIIFGSFSGS